MENKIEHYFIKHLSDKFESRYHFVYNDLFEPIRYNKIKLLEIGLGTIGFGPSNMVGWKEKNKNYLPGASLRAFKDYFPNGIIYGIDMQEDCMFEEDRILTFLSDSRDSQKSDELFSDLTFDIIIDDGDHTSEGQIRTFNNFFKKLKNGGLYFIEDVAFLNEVKEYFENTNLEYKFHNRLLVIKKIL
jgi:hypothetical protein